MEETTSEKGMKGLRLKFMGCNTENEAELLFVLLLLFWMIRNDAEDSRFESNSDYQVKNSHCWTSSN